MTKAFLSSFSNGFGKLRLAQSVAKIPASISFKLLASFLFIAILLSGVGGIGLLMLWNANERAVDLIRQQTGIAAIRSIERNANELRFRAASVFLPPGAESATPAALSATLLYRMGRFEHDFAYPKRIIRRSGLLMLEEVSIFTDLKIQLSKLISAGEELARVYDPDDVSASLEVYRNRILPLFGPIQPSMPD